MPNKKGPSRTICELNIYIIISNVYTNSKPNQQWSTMLFTQIIAWKDSFIVMIVCIVLEIMNKK